MNPRALFMLTLAVGVCLPAAVLSAPAPSARSVSAPSKPAYWSEPRLEQPIRTAEVPSVRLHPDLYLWDAGGAAALASGRELPPVRLVGGRIVAVRELMERMSRQTGVRVLMQADWMREELMLPLRAAPARELMDRLAERYGGRWWRVGNAWVLARTMGEAELTAMPQEERYRRIGELARRVFGSFSREQWAALAANRILGAGDLTPSQWTLLQEFLRLYYFSLEHPVAVPPVAAGLKIVLGGSGRNAAVGLQGGGASYWLPFYDAITGEPLLGAPPPR